MSVGVNYPWREYGWDFGIGPWGRRPWESDIDRDLDHLRQIGVDVLRWFVLGDGLTLDRGDAIVSDFARLITRFQQHGMKLLPVLLDADVCAERVSVDGGFYKSGRREIVGDAAQRAAFFDRIFVPLLQVSRTDTIFAWEAMSEPERTGLPAATMRSFLLEANQRIQARGYASTIGFQRPETMREWSDVRGTLPQFHYYGSPGSLPDAENGSAFVGEFASAWPPNENEAWLQLGPDQDTHTRLCFLQELGYRRAFVWSYYKSPGDDRSDWDNEVERDIADAVAGRCDD